MWSALPPSACGADRGSWLPYRHFLRYPGRSRISQASASACRLPGPSPTRTKEHSRISPRPVWTSRTAADPPAFVFWSSWRPVPSRALLRAEQQHLLKLSALPLRDPSLCQRFPPDFLSSALLHPEIRRSVMQGDTTRASPSSRGNQAGVNGLFQGRAGSRALPSGNYP